MKTKPRPGDLRHPAFTRNSDYHHIFAAKAAAEAARVLRFFESERPDDSRPRQAITAIEAWSHGIGKLGMVSVRKLALAAHAAARSAKSDPAKFAARAAGHAIATWHVPTHSLATFSYAAKADYSARCARSIRTSASRKSA